MSANGLHDEIRELNLAYLMLTQHMLGPMLVGGFISVTIVSVILAGILVGYLAPVID